MSITRCPSGCGGTTAGEAFDSIIIHRPYNNTNPSASWCELAHCPRGCRTHGMRDQPIIQDPLHDTVGELPVPTGRFRCPNCLTEYIPGQDAKDNWT